MSSTQRGYNRHKADYYVTPQGCIEEFLTKWLEDLVIEKSHLPTMEVIPYDPNKALWLDPCAGGDELHKMSYPAVIEKCFNPTVLDTIDIREDSLASRKEDYLLVDDVADKYDIIITNPPFYLAEQIIRKALADVKDGGYVAMLLRLNFFGSKTRKPLFEEFMPGWTYVHHRRMSFTDDGSTDSIEYMHAVWRKGLRPDFTKLRII